MRSDFFFGKIMCQPSDFLLLRGQLKIDHVPPPSNQPLI
jgi:hypothetical protein